MWRTSETPYLQLWACHLFVPAALVAHSFMYSPETRSLLVLREMRREEFRQKNLLINREKSCKEELVQDKGARKNMENKDRGGRRAKRKADGEKEERGTWWMRRQKNTVGAKEIIKSNLNMRTPCR